MVDLTVIILTKNEETNIARCIDSIKCLADRIIVVDSGSEDSTVKIATELGAEVYEHCPFVSHGHQFNWALDHLNITTTWVYRIDADEVVPLELRREIQETCFIHKEDDVNALEMRFRIYFMGKYLYHGGVYPFKKVNIFKYGKARFNETPMRDDVVLAEGVVKSLNNDCLHYDFKDLSTWVQKHNWYSDNEVDVFLSGGENDLNGLSKDSKKRKILKNKLYYKLPVLIRAKFYFWYRFYFRFGFLDGIPGYIYAYLQAYWYRFMIDAKIIEKVNISKHLKDEDLSHLSKVE